MGEGSYTDSMNVSKCDHFCVPLHLMLGADSCTQVASYTPLPQLLLPWRLLLRLLVCVCVFLCLFCFFFFRLLAQDDTPFSGGCFNLEIEFPAEYPFKAPKVIRLALAS